MPIEMITIMAMDSIELIKIPVTDMVFDEVLLSPKK